MSGEEIRHQLEETIVSHIATQLIEKQRAFVRLQREMVDWIWLSDAGRAIFRPMRGHLLDQVFRLQILVISGRTGREPGIGVGCRQYPTLPQASAVVILLFRFSRFVLGRQPRLFVLLNGLAQGFGRLGRNHPIAG